MTTSYIIHYRKDSEDRKFNLETILRYLSTVVSNCKEIIVINDDAVLDKELLELRDTYPYANFFFFKNEDEFKKSAAFNFGAGMATGDIFCFYDTDVLIDDVYLCDSSEMIELGEADHVYPYNGVFVDIEKEEFPKFLEHFNLSHLVRGLQESTIGWHGNNMTVASTTSPGGVTMISRAAFDRMNGFDENFVGWGFEDTDFERRSRKVNIVSRIIAKDAICWHLHHDNARRLENTHYHRNLQIFNRNCTTQL